MKKFLSLFLVAALITTLQLIARAQTQVPKPALNVAILIFEGVQIIDYTGPYEVLGAAGLNVYTVSEKSDPITTNMGMSVNPKYNFENMPKADIVVIPGGWVGKHIDNQKVIQWIQTSAKDAKFVLSVCNGAFFLAKAGLLDGLEATTTAMLVNDLQEDAPKTKVVFNKRFVDNGKIITSGGLSAGIEGALHVVSRLYGEGTANAIALGIEYNWQPNSTFLPATYARRYLRATRQFLYPLKPITNRSTGKEDQWEEVLTLETATSAEELLKQIDNNLTTQAKWVKNGAGNHGGDTSQWKFTDETGKAWSGTVNVHRSTSAEGQLVITTKIVRLG